MANNYTTTTDAFASIPEANYQPLEYPVMSAYIATASRFIDMEVGRWEGFFYPTTDSVTRYYDGSDGETLDIDEFVSISDVSVAETGGTASTDYTAWTSTDYFVEPYNYASLGKPINRLVIDSNGSKAGWYGFRKSVAVTGIPGYASSTPRIIETACQIQAVRWFMRGKGGWQDTGGNENVGTMRYKGPAELDGDIRAMLHPYKLELGR